MIDRPAFFRFGGENTYRKSTVKVRPSVKYETLELIEAGSPLTNGAVFEVVSGTRWKDITPLADSLHFLVSQRVVDALVAIATTGWSTYPVSCNAAPVTFHGFMAIARVGPLLNLEAINNYETEVHDFDLNTWDGSDLFSVQDTLDLVCTERIMLSMKRSQITGIDLRPY